MSGTVTCYKLCSQQPGCQIDRVRIACRSMSHFAVRASQDCRNVRQDLCFSENVAYQRLTCFVSEVVEPQKYLKVGILWYRTETNCKQSAAILQMIAWASRMMEMSRSEIEL
jgi:hypothetical protein